MSERWYWVAEVKAPTASDPDQQFTYLVCWKIVPVIVDHPNRRPLDRLSHRARVVHLHG
jgi:hypothetical protein